MSPVLTVTEVAVHDQEPRGYRKVQSRMRIYFSHQGESVMEDFLGGRRDRPQKLYRQVFDEVFNEVGRQGHLVTAQLLRNADREHEIKWSQKAGCQCGCSPAFIANGVYGHDLFVTVTGPKTNYEHETGEPLITVLPAPEQTALEYFVENLGK